MSASPSSPHALVLQAAREAAGAQHYPQGALYVVATPIGNLADISLRAVHVLQTVDAIACEDTRHTQALLRALGIDKPAGAWLAVHRHNEAQAAALVLARLRTGERVAYASDAGTPAVSDPGARLAALVREAGLRVVPVPGPSSVTALLSAAGGTGDDPSFVFGGFLPAKAGERQTAVGALAHEPRAVVLLEAPHRIADAARALAGLGDRPITVGRELTKQFEQIATMPCRAFAHWLDADPQRSRGEFALLLHPWPHARPRDDGKALLELLLAEGLAVKAAVRVAAQSSGASRNELYAHALALRRREEPGAPDAQDG